MAKILSQDEIDALLSNVTGEVEPIPEDETKQKVTLYDFKHPNLVSKEQMRLLETIHEGICRNFGVFLSAQLRLIVEMNLLAIDQIMYSEFVMSISAPSCIYVCQSDEPPSQFVLEINPQLAIYIVERLFGGQGSIVNEVRPISIIEQKIMKRVVNRIAHEISKNWDTVATFTAEVERFESNPEFVQIIPSSEPVVVVSTEIKIHEYSTLLNICYPYTWISNLLSTPEVQERILFGSREASVEEKQVIEQGLKSTPVKIRAMLGKSHISVKEFLDLKKGDVITLDNRTSDLLPVYINKKHMFNSIAGTRNRRYAIRIVSAEQGEQDDGT